MATNITPDDRTDLFTKTRHRLGAPVRKVEITNDQLDTLLSIAVEDYVQYQYEWLVDNQWPSLIGLDVSEADAAANLTTRDFDYETQFTYAYSKAVGLQSRGPWELKTDFVELESGKQQYLIPANRELNEVLWFTPPSLDQAVIDPFMGIGGAFGAGFGGEGGLAQFGMGSYYVMPAFDVLLRQSDRNLKNRLIRGDLTYKVHDYPLYDSDGEPDYNGCESGQSKQLGVVTKTNNGVHIATGSGGSVRRWKTPSEYDSFQDDYQSPLNRIKYLHADEIGLAFIQLPDAKTIMERMAYLGIIDFDYFTYTNDDWSCYGNQCRITNPQMDKAIVDPEYAISGGHIDSEEEWKNIECTSDPHYTDPPLTSNDWEYNNCASAEDNYITIYSESVYAGNGGSAQVRYAVPTYRFTFAQDSILILGEGWKMNGKESYSTASLTNYSHMNSGAYTIQPPITGVSPYGNIIWIFGVKEHKDADWNDVNNENWGTGIELSKASHCIFRYITVTFCPNAMDWGSFQWMPPQSGDGAPDGGGTIPDYILDRIATETYDATLNMNTGSFTDQTIERENFQDLETGMVSGVKGHYALSELFDLRGFPLYIPYERQGTGFDFNGDSSTWMKPTYRAFWNGIEENGNSLLKNHNGRYACMDSMKNSSKWYDGGKHRWFALSIKSLHNYTKAGFLQPLYGLCSDQVNNPSSNRLQHIGFGEGTQTTFITDNDFLSLRAKIDEETAKGKRIGFKFKLPDVDISDNISLAHHAYWMRKVEITQFEPEEGRDSGDGNYFEMYASAYDYNEDEYNSDNESDYLRTTTSLFKETFNDVTVTGNDNNTTPLLFDNVSNLDPTILYEGQTTTYDFSLFDGSLDDQHFIWGEPGDFNSFNVLIHTSKQDSSSALDFVCNIGLYQNYIRHVADFENLTDSDFYLSTKGRMIGSQIIENPADVIKDLVITELNLPAESINSSEFSTATSENNSFKLGFSVTNKIDSKRLIEAICTNTKIFPRINGQNTLGLITIKDDYDETVDYTRIVEHTRILKYNFTRSKIDELKTKVMVMYNKDYATDNFRDNTGWFSCKDFLGDGDLGFIHPEHGEYGYRLNNFNLNEEDTKLIFEAQYIKDRETAYKLQEFLSMWYCNQHTKISVDLDITYLNLEVGDIIKFDKLINNVKAFGEDYTKTQVRNGQVIYPLFLIESITKTDKAVKLNCIQLHKLSPEYLPPPCGDTRRLYHWDGGINIYQGFPFDDQDWINIEDYYYNNSEYTRLQIKQMDINGTNSVTLKDSILYRERLSATPPYYPWSDSERYFQRLRKAPKLTKETQQEQSAQ